MHSHRFCFRIFFVRFGTGKAIASRIPWTVHSAVCAIRASPASETTAYSASQKFLRILCQLKVSYRAQNSPTLVPIVNQINPITTFQPNPIKANCNTSIIESTTISVKFQPNLQVSANKLVVHCSSLSFVPLIWGPYKTILKITNYGAPPYVLFSIFLSFLPS